MSLDFLQVSQQVQKLGEKALQRQHDLQTRLGEARASLEDCAADVEPLRLKVLQVAGQHDQTLRCAIPVAEVLNAHFPVPPELGPVTLIAADGSQIFADRHTEVEYGLVNTGAI